MITGIRIIIDNGLEGIYTLHSSKTDRTERRRENSYPLAMTCRGRKISGEIKYRHQIDPLGFAERLSGPSALSNGGLIIKFAGAKITIPEIVWSPSSSQGNISDFQDRTLNWAMVAQHFNSMPILEYDGEI